MVLLDQSFVSLFHLLDRGGLRNAENANPALIGFRFVNLSGDVLLPSLTLREHNIEIINRLIWPDVSQILKHAKFEAALTTQALPADQIDDWHNKRGEADSHRIRIKNSLIERVPNNSVACAAL